MVLPIYLYSNGAKRRCGRYNGAKRRCSTIRILDIVSFRQSSLRFCQFIYTATALRAVAANTTALRAVVLWFEFLCCFISTKFIMVQTHSQARNGAKRRCIMLWISDIVPRPQGRRPFVPLYVPMVPLFSFLIKFALVLFKISKTRVVPSHHLEKSVKTRVGFLARCCSV